MKSFIKSIVISSLPIVAFFPSLGAQAWNSGKINCEGADGGKIASGAFSTASNSSYSTAQAFSGSTSCKLGITKGSDGWGEFGGSYTFPTKLAKGAEVWVQVHLFVPSGFQISTNTGVLKFMRVHTASASGGNDGYHDLLISNPGAVNWNSLVGNWSSSYVYNYEGFPNLIPVGVTSKNDVVKGAWETYEMYVKFDSVSKNAGGSAEVRVWKNNTLLVDKTDQATLVSSTAVADFFYLFTYWNGNAPATQSLYVDDIVLMSDTPANRDAAGHPFIGGGAAATTIAPPSAPTLNVQ